MPLPPLTTDPRPWIEGLRVRRVADVGWEIEGWDSSGREPEGVAHVEACKRLIPIDFQRLSKELNASALLPIQAELHRLVV